MSLAAPTSLPTPTAFLTSLISTLPSTSTPHEAPTSPSAIPPTTKSPLLTLHAIFPTLLLPALDLLDRHLITRLVLQDGPTEQATSGNDRHERKKVVYYVKSNAHRDGRSRYSRGGDVGGTSYEVRTEVWSCTCAAFAFSAFNRPGAFPEYESCGDGEEFEGNGALVNEDEEMLDVPELGGGDDGAGDWQWGGLMLGDEEVPLCKHLLACVLAEKWGGAGGMVEEREVGREEMAGWAAGWGG